eukprot:1034229-Amphidinium_carterae.1
MNPTWNTGMNNRDFIRSFTTWKDKIFQHEEHTQILNGLNMNMRNPDFDAAMQTVEDYYRNTYIDNEQGNFERIQRKVRQSKTRKTTNATTET